MGNTSSKGPFSIAVLVYQRVIRVLFWSDVEKTGVASSMSNFEFLVSNHLIWQATHRCIFVFFWGVNPGQKSPDSFWEVGGFFCTQMKQNMTEFDKKSFERSPMTSRCILWFGVLGIFWGVQIKNLSRWPWMSGDLYSIHNLCSQVLFLFKLHESPTNAIRHPSPLSPLFHQVKRGATHAECMMSPHLQN